MDAEVRRRCDDEQPARLEDAVDLVKGAPDFEDVLESLDRRTQVGIVDLAFDLIRAELEDRPGTVEGFNDNLTERLVVIAIVGAPP